MRVSSSRFLVVAISVVSTLGVEGAIPQSERDALVDLYESTNGPSWSVSTGWLGPPGTECDWSDVVCDPSGSTVVSLDPAGRRLDGVIPGTIGNLTNLTTLDLSGNALKGGIPTELWNLTKLTVLDLERNELSGSIPPGISALSNLTTLRLGGNALTGEIPQELASLDMLTRLALGPNNFDTDFGALIQIVRGIGGLERLLLRGMGLTGAIPETLSELSNLVLLDLAQNEISEPVSQALATSARLPKLEILNLRDNELDGELPADFASFTKLRTLDLTANRITGSIPPELGSIPTLEELGLGSNQLSGTIPRELGNLTSLEELFLNHNDLTGEIPAELGNLTSLFSLLLGSNRLTGPFPSFLTNLPFLGWLSLYDNRLTGPLPPEIGDFEELLILELDGNEFTGEIPPEIGNLDGLLDLWLASNLLEGEIPPEIGNLRDLGGLQLYSNNLRGEVPRSILELPPDVVLGLDDNALTATDPEVAAFVGEAHGYPLEDFQTVPPSDVEVAGVTAVTVALRWTAVSYSWNAGGYQVLGSTSPGGPFTPLAMTPTKYDGYVEVTGLQPSTTYSFVVKTVTFPHGTSPYYQLNTVFSDPSRVVQATTLDASTESPDVILTAFPRGLLQSPGEGGATDGYTLTNVGGAATTITLAQEGDFFDQAPASFELLPGASQRVVLTGRARPLGDYSGASLPSGDGLPSPTRIHVTLVSLPRPTAGWIIEAVEPRLDLSAPAGEDPAGFVTFRNVGTEEFNGVASADVQFLAPQRGVITIPPGGSTDVRVESIRSLRPDSLSLAGTQLGQVSLIGIGGLGANGRATSNGSAAPSLVTVTDTVKPTVAPATAPPVAPGEVVLFLTGVGHVRGSVGEFVSDVSILDSLGSNAATSITLYYTSSNPGSPTRQVSYGLGGGTSEILLADTVKTVFDGSSEVGTIQIRSPSARTLSASANVFNRSNPEGYYGTSLPVLRSDRAAANGEEQVLTGLRKDASGHTNVYLQETSGLQAQLRLDYLARDGSVVGSGEDNLAPFQMKSLLDPLPEGAVAARITTTGGAGAIAAFATPVDRASGDTWAVADWSRFYGYSPTEAVVIPVGGAVRGANDTYFKTDVAITNRCASVAESGRGEACTSPTGRGILRYYPNTGGSMEIDVTLPLLGTTTMTDIVRTAFGFDTDTVGHLVFVPVTGGFSVTSRTYTIVEGSPATYGSSVPAIGSSIALRPGQSRRIGALSDSTRRTTGARTPATNRTNFGVVETSGRPAAVRVSVYYNDPASLASGAALGTRTWELAPHQFLSQSNLVEAIVGPAREELYGNLSGIQVQFDLVSPDGAIVVWTSSVDNGTGDSVLRTE